MQQFRVVGPRGEQLDRLALVPQWKFFGQSRIGVDISCFDDMCVLARISPDPDGLGDWCNIVWWRNRDFGDALWNPALRERTAIGEAVARLIENEEPGGQPCEPSSLAYLTVLRACIDTVPPSRGDAIQFAVATTRGRTERTVVLRFLSAWHIP